MTPPARDRMLREELAAVIASVPGVRLAPPAIRMPAVADPALTAISIGRDTIDIRLTATRLPITTALNTLAAALESSFAATGHLTRRLRLNVVGLDPQTLTSRNIE